MTDENSFHIPYITRCLELAHQAALEDEVPVGALLVHGGQVIAEAYNRREQDHSVLGHAELLVIHEGAKKLGGWRLEDCTLYSSLEPCVMCAGAIVQARIPRVVYGASDTKAGGQSLFELLNHPKLNHRCELVEGVLAKECGALLSQFFKKKRQKED
jgi:tRNA(adenine34) deaminase